MRSWTVALAAVVATACAHGWWKPGASAADLKADQAACREEAGIEEPEGRTDVSWGESPAFDACMRAKGWHGGNTAILPRRAAQSKPTAAPRRSPRASGAVSGDSAVARAEGERAVDEVGAAQEPSGPLLSGAGAWWKFGANGAALERDESHCRGEEDQTGDGAQPSAAFLRCMRERGWIELAR